MDIRPNTLKSALISLLVVTASMVTAAEPSDGVDTRANVVGDNGAQSTPWISSKVPEPVRARLEASYNIATRHLRDNAECRSLFAELGGNGFEALSSTLYYPASQQNEKQVCKSAFGYTTVGSAPTFLCRRFSRLSERTAALVLIHEGLRRAGMGEWPQEDQRTRLERHQRSRR